MVHTITNNINTIEEDSVANEEEDVTGEESGVAEGETGATGEPARYNSAYVLFRGVFAIFVTGHPQNKYESVDPGYFSDVPMNSRSLSKYMDPPIDLF